MINKNEMGPKSTPNKKTGSSKGTSKTLSGPAMYTKVNQATIDKIKSQGMTKALKTAATSKDAAYVQGVKRMYGADRLKAAMGSTKSSGSSSSQKITPERGAGFKKTSPYAFSGTKNAAKPKPSAPGAISNKSKSSAPGAISGKKVSTTSSSTKKSTNTKFRPGSVADNIANNRGIFGNKKK